MAYIQLGIKNHIPVMLPMLNPAFKKALHDKGIILTTWRELMERRTRVTAAR